MNLNHLDPNEREYFEALKQLQTRAWTPEDCLIAIHAARTLALIEHRSMNGSTVAGLEPLSRVVQSAAQHLQLDLSARTRETGDARLYIATMLGNPNALAE